MEMPCFISDFYTSFYSEFSTFNFYLLLSLSNVVAKTYFLVLG